MFKVVLFGLYVPLPPLHVPEVAPPPTIPARLTVLLEQITWSAPAFTVAAGLMVNIKLSLTIGQGPVGSLVVRVSVTLPEAISAALGVYTAVIEVIVEKLPDPEEDHVADVAPPPKFPDKVAVVFEHIVLSAPAFTVANGLIVICI